MKQTLLILSASALAFAAPAIAKPGNGHGPGYGAGNNPGMAHRNQGQNTGLGTTYGYGQGGCPPGLAKKAVSCVPPGQAKKQFGVGQQIPYGYNGLMGYNALPRDLRTRYGTNLDPRSRYLLDNSYLYRVDPRTMIVSQVLSSVLGGR